MKVFVFDSSKCNGCYGCQLACKDEHCDNDWSPISLPQPDTGQFWCHLEEVVHGQVPKVRMEYTPKFGGQDSAIADYAPEVMMEREDGLRVIDPVKAAGRKDLAEKFPGVFWNEELNVPQACTGCAHLVDEGQLPHCVDVCPTLALRFGDEEEFADEIAVAETFDTGTGKPNVYSITLPRGTMIADVDYGNWNFTQTKMFPGKFHEATLVASFPNAEWEINLSHSYKDGDGEWQRETERVRVGALAEALARKSA